METIDEELEAKLQHQELEQSFDSSTLDDVLAQFQVIRRNGQLTEFNANKISAAMLKAFLAVEHSQTPSARIKDITQQLTKQVMMGISRRLKETGKVHIEEIQDQVELALMRAGEHKVARAYVLYREQHAAKRAEQKVKTVVSMIDENGTSQPLDEQRLRQVIIEACSGLDDVDSEAIIHDSLKNLFDGITERDLNNVLIMTVRALIEREPNYTYVASRLLLDRLRSETLAHIGHTEHYLTAEQMGAFYPEYFKKYLEYGIQYELLAPELMSFDVARLGQALRPERDLNFTYLGLQTLYDRYFLHWQDTRFELPQAFFMRVAMGLSVNEDDREARAIEFYELLSSFSLMSSTPTLFNSGTLRPQLSSCFISTVPDDLDGIFSAIKDNAMMQKWAGGIGNDWTNVRGMGSIIKGTNGKSQGVVPFLKVANDTLVSVNQCLAPDTLVYTAQGARPIKSIKKGDLVLGREGYYRPVTEHLIYNQTEEMVEINVRHSTFPVKITSGHPIWSCQIQKSYHTPKQTVELLQKGEIEAGYCEAGKLQKGDFVAQAIPKEIIPAKGFSEQDARLYGIMLGDGHCSKRQESWGTKFEWGVSGNPNTDTHLQFVRNYLTKRGIHFWEKNARENYLQIGWAYSLGVVCDATTGQFTSGIPSLPFDYNDLYNSDGIKYISSRFMHLPLNQTKQLIRGLLETDGSGLLLNFSNTSGALVEGLRYLLLRLGIPSAATYRERYHQHTGKRADGTEIHFNGITKAYDLRIPSVPDFAEYFNYKVAEKKYWFEWKGYLFTRITEIKSISPVPFVFDLKVEGDHSYMTNSFAVSNGGKRRGSGCAYLEVWHIDIDEFLELRKNTGDERRRTHDMNTAAWVSDLFMQRVHDAGQWSLFSPDETPDLHGLYGAAFKARYEHYEALGQQGKLNIYKQVSAVELWRKILTMLFETGHPWLCFKDPCNIRSPQQHVGVVHSSNLCTEITLNTKAYAEPEKNVRDGEIAVCNLSSVNLPEHIENGKLNVAKLQKTVTTAMRMLDNVIDINYYSVPQAKNANLKHRPVGLGIMGFQDSLYKMRIPYASQEAVEFADETMEFVSYYAISASSDLARERGKYPSFDGSLWSQGVLPIDSIQRLKAERGNNLKLNTGARLDWHHLREKVKTQGMRNSNTMAIAPTATISSICGVSQSIEPMYQNLFIKTNLSGSFAIINQYLVRDLKALGLWDDVMMNDLKYYDGSVQDIERIPQHIKELYATAFEIAPEWLVECASRRQKWIDQSQSLNLYMKETSGIKLDALYKLAWIRGLKTTYYLRTMGATRVQKSTLKPSAVPPQACAIDDPECEACQ